MKHSKQRNVGIMFEILNHAVLNEISKGHNKTAAGIFSVIKKHFMSETQISKAYRVYSQLLYSEARNPYYAIRFFGNLVKEYVNTVDDQKLYNENNIKQGGQYLSSRGAGEAVLRQPSLSLFAGFRGALPVGQSSF